MEFTSTPALELRLPTQRPVRRGLARLEFTDGPSDLHRRDPRKALRLKAIESDVGLNPRIGSGWMRRGKQMAAPTPGQNQKNYLEGALHAHTGKLVWVAIGVRIRLCLSWTTIVFTRVSWLDDGYKTTCSSSPSTTRGSTSSNGCGRRCMTPSPETIVAVPC